VDELIVRIARAIACISRLRILSAVSRVDEVPPTRLARQIRMSPHLLSAHLRRLSGAGLIQRRRSGGWHYCRSGSPYGPGALSAEMADLLVEVLHDAAQSAEDYGLQQLRNPTSAALDAAVQGLVFEVATAFTSVRRVQILRWLSAVGTCDAGSLCGELHMSDAAASRHMAKLVRRGYVVGSRSGRRLAYRLAPTCRTPLHARVLDIIRLHWGDAGRGSGKAPREDGRGV